MDREVEGQPLREPAKWEQGSDPVAALVEKTRKRLKLGDINEYTQAWLDLGLETHGLVSETETRMIYHVGTALRFLTYDKLRDTRQALLLVELAKKRTHDKVDRLVLPYDDAHMLQQAAAAVNIPYDPGTPENTPENIEKRTFKFIAVEQKAPPVAFTQGITRLARDGDRSHWSTNVVAGEKVVDSTIEYRGEK